jgi:hypothetical protein
MISGKKPKRTPVTADARAAKVVQFIGVEDDVKALSDHMLALDEERNDVQRPRGSTWAAPWMHPTTRVGPSLHRAFHRRRYDCAKLLVDAGESWRLP